MCKSFPIDQRDIDEVALSGGTCGYRFEKHPLIPPFSNSESARHSQEIGQIP